MDDRIEAFCSAVHAIGGKASERNGMEYEVRIGDATHALRLFPASVVFPRDAREIAWRAMAARADGVTPLIVAEVVSDGARVFLREQSVGYADIGGSLFLPVPGAYVLVDRPAPKREKRMVKGVLSGKTSLAAHVLMSAKEPINGTEISRLSGLSVGSVSSAMERLERMGWVSTSGSGPRKLRRISDRRGLLENWRTIRLAEGPVGKMKFYVPGVSDPRELAAMVARVAAGEGVDYALSGAYGAQIHAPYLTSTPQVVCRIRKQDINVVASALGARSVGEGWNLGIVPSDLPSGPVFRQQIDGLWVATPLVCWVDTVAEGGRAPELAAHLAQERIL
jgi:hypothetical protein